MAEPCFRRVELLDQIDDAVFEMVDRHIVGTRVLDLLDLVGQ